MTRQEDGHGPFVGFPVYEAGAVYARIPDGETFGFWPGSNNVYVVTNRKTWIADQPGHVHEDASVVNTWFYGSDGTFAGWIDARRLADAPSLDGMLFLDNQCRITTLTGSYQVTAIEQFVWPDGSVAQPTRIFPDVRMGFFTREAQLELARW
jgi:hypothetical protein